MKKARRLLDEFLENNKNLFERHDLEIDADEIHDGQPQNAYAFVDVYEKRDENKDGWKVNPFPKPVGLRFGCYAAANNGEGCFYLSFFIPMALVGRISEKMVDLIIPHNPDKWTEKKWNGTDSILIKPEHFRQLTLETIGVRFEELNYDESQEIESDDVQKMIVEKTAQLENATSWFYSYFFDKNDAESAFEEFFDGVLPIFKSEKIDWLECVAKIQARRGQGRFRRQMMKYWENKCAFTECDNPELLVACHAKPCAACENVEQRMSPYNGFLLRTDIAYLFNKGFITFLDCGLVVISKKLSDEDQKAFGLYGDMSIRKLDEKHREFLHYHQKYVWQDRDKGELILKMNGYL